MLNVPIDGRNEKPRHGFSPPCPGCGVTLRSVMCNSIRPTTRHLPPHLWVKKFSFLRHEIGRECKWAKDLRKKQLKTRTVALDRLAKWHVLRDGVYNVCDESPVRRPPVVYSDGFTLEFIDEFCDWTQVLACTTRDMYWIVKASAVRSQVFEYLEHWHKSEDYKYTVYYMYKKAYSCFRQMNIVFDLGNGGFCIPTVRNVHTNKWTGRFMTRIEFAHLLVDQHGPVIKD